MVEEKSEIYTSSFCCLFNYGGGYSFAAVSDAEFNDLKDKVDKLEKSRTHYFGVKSTVTEAGSNYDNDGATGKDSIAIGGKAASRAEGNIAIGYESEASEVGAANVGNIAIGYKSKSLGNESIALGKEAKAMNQDSISIGKKAESDHLGISIGRETNTKGTSAIAIGYNSKADGQAATALGRDVEARGVAAISMGENSASVSDSAASFGGYAKSFGNASTAIGYESIAAIGKPITEAEYSALGEEEKKIYRAKTVIITENGVPKVVQEYWKTGAVAYNIALGAHSKTNVFGGVALGAYSVAEEESYSTALGYSSKANVLRAVALGAFSVADRKGFTEETIAPFSNEDLKGQTYGAVSVGGNGKLRQIINVGDATAPTDAVNLRQLTAVDLKIASITGDMANKANVNLDNITVAGKEVITGLIDVAGGTGITVEAKGKDGKKTFTVSLDKTLTDQINKEESVSEAADGMVAVDSTKTNTSGGKDFVVDLKKDVKDKINRIGTGAIEAGNHGTVTGDTVFKYVDNASANASIAYKGDGETTPKMVKASEGFHFKGDDNIKVSTENNGGVNYKLSSNLKGIESVSNGDTKITLGKDKTVDFGGSKVTNIGEGEVSATSKDAVNGSQLYETNTRVDGLEKANNNQMEGIHRNAERIDNLKTEVGHVGSLGAALAALNPMQYDPLQKNQVMAGLGHYRDKQAVAVGVTHYFNENLMMTAGIAVGSENRVKTMANVGITWKIGKDEDRKELPERYKEGPIGSIYMMQGEMEALLKENQAQKLQLQEQQNRMEKMEQQLELLLKKK